MLALRRLVRAVTRNVARTRPDADDPRLRTLRADAPREAAWDAALSAARSMPGWTVTAADAERGEIRAEARTRTLGFTDDVTVRVSGAEGGGSTVDVRSASRVGRMDLGTNARRVARFLRRTRGFL